MSNRNSTFSAWCTFIYTPILLLFILLFTGIKKGKKSYRKWDGVIPFYIKDEESFKKQRLSMANIKSERILEDKQSYRYKIRNKRCLIPENGFYKYRGIKGWKNKVPYYIHLKDQPIFLIPGLNSVAQLPDENREMQERWTYALITRPANSLMHKIHNAGDNPYRMPLMLPLN